MISEEVFFHDLVVNSQGGFLVNVIKLLAVLALLDFRSQFKDGIEPTLRVDESLTFLEFSSHSFVLLNFFSLLFLLTSVATFGSLERLINGVLVTEEMRAVLADATENLADIVEHVTVVDGLLEGDMAEMSRTGSLVTFASLA
jgi:hypothetical protein